MRVVLFVVVGAALGACAGEDEDGPFRPGGGGGGGGGGMTGGDARMTDAPGGDGGAQLNGLICSVNDLRVPDACPTVASQAGVTVSVRGTATTTTSGSNGRYTLDVPGGTLTLDAAAGSTTFERTLLPVTVSGAEVETPVVTRAAFAAVIGSLGTVVPDGGGTVVAYVVDGNSAARDVDFATIAGSSVAPYYDNGGATQWTQSGGTGAAGVALFVDVPAGSVSLDGIAADTRVARATVPVAVDAITFVRIALVAGP